MTKMGKALQGFTKAKSEGVDDKTKKAFKKVTAASMESQIPGTINNRASSTNKVEAAEARRRSSTVRWKNLNTSK